MIARNIESLIFYGIAKIFIDPVGLERQANLDYSLLLKLKSLVGLEKILSYRFQYSAKNDN